jgi:uncharacterized protein YcaQ
VNEILLARERSGELEVFEVGGVRWYVDVNQLGRLEAPKKLAPGSKASDRILLLSPFDNLVIQRDRLRALFGFDYNLECYVPEGKRKYGYFSLPVLQGDQFVGRIDCKAQRDLTIAINGPAAALFSVRKVTKTKAQPLSQNAHLTH